MIFDPIKMQWRGWIMGVHVTMTDKVMQEIKENESSRQSFLAGVDEKWAQENTDFPIIMGRDW